MNSVVKFLALILLAVGLSGCVSVQERESNRLAGHYSGTDNNWFVDVMKDGTFRFSFWEQGDTNANRPTTLGGYCDFESAEDPLVPDLTINAALLSGKFKFEFVPEREQLNVILLLPDDHHLVMANGNKVKLFRTKRNPQLRVTL